MKLPLRYYLGEDIVTTPIPAGKPRSAIIQHLLASGDWAEVVPGIGDITVKFDPEKLPPDTAVKRLEAQLQRVEPDMSGAQKAISLPTYFDDDAAPDAAMVAGALGIARDELPDWLIARRYEVAMMGFQPGFAYLEDKIGDNLPNIGRLTTPRQHVRAGSIGLLGSRACIYALDGPGGWPIVGTVTVPLIDMEKPNSPFLLSVAAQVAFADARD